MGNFIQTERKKRHLNQKQLAELIHVSTTTVCKWEKGVNIPDIANLEKLAELFQVSIQEILNGETSIDESKEGGSEPTSPQNHPDIHPGNPMPTKHLTLGVPKQHWKIGLCALLTFLMVISVVIIFYGYMSRPKFSVIREFCPESYDLGRYEKYYNKEDIICIIVEYSGNAEEDDFNNYNTVLYDKYLYYFDRFNIIAIAYFDNYNPKKDTFDSASYQTLYFNTQDQDVLQHETIHCSHINYSSFIRQHAVCPGGQPTCHQRKPSGRKKVSPKKISEVYI